MDSINQALKVGLDVKEILEKGVVKGAEKVGNLYEKSEILKRVHKFNRLYLEFGGKLIYDDHASRVLPGYKKTTKAELIQGLKGAEIIYCINAKHLQSKKILGLKKRSYLKVKINKDQSVIKVL